MKTLCLMLIPLLHLVTTIHAECPNDWVAYKDKLCIRIFNSKFLNYAEAQSFCSFLSTEYSPASQVMVKEEDLQQLLADYTHEVYDNLWLGGKYDAFSGQYKWDDGAPLSYNNWQEGYPSNVTEPDACIELRPRNAKGSINVDGKWADATCEKRNLVMCQRSMSVSLEDILDQLELIRKELEDVKLELGNATEDRNELRDELEQTKEELRNVSNRVVPVGSTYVEYYDQPSPRTLWPNLVWEDISSTYAGLFFRASGGGSATWGATQAECAPRISDVEYAYSNEERKPNPISIPTSGWSSYGWTGEHMGTGDLHQESMRFNVEGCEVRPINQAIRVWKRMA